MKNGNKFRRPIRKIPALSNTIKEKSPYKPIPLSQPPSKQSDKDLVSHFNQPVHTVSSIPADKAIELLESHKDRFLERGKKVYELKRFSIYTPEKEPIEPFLNANLPNGLLFKGILFGNFKAIGAFDGKIDKIILHRPNSRRFAIVVYLKSSAYPGLHFSLQEPSKKYRDIYKTFIWFAFLTKCVSEWLEEFPLSKYDQLKDCFSAWLDKRFSSDEDYFSWKNEISTGGDYRHFLPSARFLLHMQISDQTLYPILAHPCLQLDSQAEIPQEIIYEEESLKTLVTPRVFKWFAPLFKDQMRTIENLDVDGELKETNSVNSIQKAWDMSNPIPLRDTSGNIQGVKLVDGIINVGDFVEIECDDEDEIGAWVARIISFKETNSIKFRLVWMYTYRHTILNRMSTHCSAELFYTTHCECKNQLFPLSFIKCRVEVEMGTTKGQTNLASTSNFFCRFFYDEVETAFIDINQALIKDFNTGQLLCTCTVSNSIKLRKKAVLLDQYQMGRAFLLDLSAQPDMEWISPVKELLTIGQLISYDDATQLYSFQIFPRFREIVSYMKELKKPLDPENTYSSNLNELLYSSIIVKCPQICIMNTCFIEFRPENVSKANLPTYLQHRGAGNLFYFTFFSSLDMSSISKPTEDQKHFFLKQFPPRHTLLQKAQQLNALDLFSGSGSLGLGIGDAGAAHSRWAVDFEAAATEAYQRNHPKDRQISLFTESVNVSLHKMFDKHPSYPKQGEVDLILAGTPCQGYSLLNRHRESATSLLKSSMITSLAAYVDYFRPSYILMEQIRFDTANDNQSKYPFNSLMAFFLSLGYQVRFKVLSAANHGTCQNRNRVFIWCAALGKPLPSYPSASHLTLFENTFTIPLPTYERTEAHQSPRKAPLPYITIRDAIGDLPPLGPFCSSRDPGVTFHHITKTRDTYQTRLERLPLNIHKANAGYLLKRAYQFNLPDLIPLKLRDGMNKRQMKQFCSRANPDGQIETIATKINIASTFPTIHYAEPRHLSVRELGRMQGFLDSDKFSGSITDQYQLIGNAVPRCVGFALGLGISSYLDHEDIQTMVQNLQPHTNGFEALESPDLANISLWFQDKSFSLATEALEGSIYEMFSKVVEIITDIKETPFRLIFIQHSSKDRFLIYDKESLQKASSIISNQVATQASGKILCLPIELDVNISEIMEEYTKENLSIDDYVE